MNEKIQAILLKIIVELKKDHWRAHPDWQLTLKSEGHVPLQKNISVRGNLGEDEWSDDVDTTIDLKLTSDDELTYFPEYTIYANIMITGGASKDIAEKSDAPVAFTAEDFNDAAKASSAGKKISNLVSNYMENEYSNYVDQNASEITAYKQGGWKADDLD